MADRGEADRKAGRPVRYRANAATAAAAAAIAPRAPAPPKPAPAPAAPKPAVSPVRRWPTVIGGVGERRRFIPEPGKD